MARRKRTVPVDPERKISDDHTYLGDRNKDKVVDNGYSETAAEFVFFNLLFQGYRYL
jgi:hypothetical protein